MSGSMDAEVDTEDVDTEPGPWLDWCMASELCAASQPAQGGSNPHLTCSSTDSSCEVWPPRLRQQAVSHNPEGAPAAATTLASAGMPGHGSNTSSNSACALIQRSCLNSRTSHAQGLEPAMGPAPHVGPIPLATLLEGCTHASPEHGMLCVHSPPAEALHRRSHRQQLQLPQLLQQQQHASAPSSDTSLSAAAGAAGPQQGSARSRMLSHYHSPVARMDVHIKLHGLQPEQLPSDGPGMQLLLERLNHRCCAGAGALAAVSVRAGCVELTLEYIATGAPSNQDSQTQGPAAGLLRNSSGHSTLRAGLLPDAAARSVSQPGAAGVSQLVHAAIGPAGRDAGSGSRGSGGEGQLAPTALRQHMDLSMTGPTSWPPPAAAAAAAAASLAAAAAAPAVGTYAGTSFGPHTAPAGQLSAPEVEQRVDGGETSSGALEVGQEESAALVAQLLREFQGAPWSRWLADAEASLPGGSTVEIQVEHGGRVYMCEVSLPGLARQAQQQAGVPEMPSPAPTPTPMPGPQPGPAPPAPVPPAPQPYNLSSAVVVSSVCPCALVCLPPNPDALTAPWATQPSGPVHLLMRLATRRSALRSIPALSSTQGVRFLVRGQGQDVPVRLQLLPRGPAGQETPPHWRKQQQDTAALLLAQHTRPATLPPRGASAGSGRGGLAAGSAAAAALRARRIAALTSALHSSTAAYAWRTVDEALGPAQALDDVVYTMWCLTLDVSALRPPCSLVLEVKAGSVLLDTQPLVLLEPSTASLAPELQELITSSPQAPSSPGTATPSSIPHKPQAPQQQPQQASQGLGGTESRAGQGQAAGGGPWPTGRQSSTPLASTISLGRHVQQQQRGRGGALHSTLSAPMPPVPMYGPDACAADGASASVSGGGAAAGGTAGGQLGQGPPSLDGSMPPPGAASVRMGAACDTARAFLKDLGTWFEFVSACSSGGPLDGALLAGTARAPFPQLGLQPRELNLTCSGSVEAARLLGARLSTLSMAVAVKDPAFQVHAVRVGCTLLHYAAAAGWPETATRLLSTLMGPAGGCSFAALKFAHGTSLLSKALASGRAGMVRSVVSWGQQFGERWSWPHPAALQGVYMDNSAPATLSTVPAGSPHVEQPIGLSNPPEEDRSATVFNSASEEAGAAEAGVPNQHSSSRSLVPFPSPDHAPGPPRSPRSRTSSPSSSLLLDSAEDSLSSMEKVARSCLDDSLGVDALSLHVPPYMGHSSQQTTCKMGHVMQAGGHVSGPGQQQQQQQLEAVMAPSSDEDVGLERFYSCVDDDEEAEDALQGQHAEQVGQPPPTTGTARRTEAADGDVTSVCATVSCCMGSGVDSLLAPDCAARACMPDQVQPHMQQLQQQPPSQQQEQQQQDQWQQQQQKQQHPKVQCSSGISSSAPLTPAWEMGAPTGAVLLPRATPLPPPRPRQLAQLLHASWFGFVHPDVECAYAKHARSWQLAQLWSGMVLLMVLLACVRSLLLGSGLGELPALLVWGGPYPFLYFVSATQTARLLPTAYLACWGGRWLCQMLLGLDLLPMPDAVAMVMKKHLGYVTDPFLYTLVEKLPVRSIPLLRAPYALSYLLLNQRLQMPHAMLHAVAVCALGGLVGLAVDVAARGIFCRRQGLNCLGQLPRVSAAAAVSGKQAAAGAYTSGSPAGDKPAWQTTTHDRAAAQDCHSPVPCDAKLLKGD